MLPNNLMAAWAYLNGAFVPAESLSIAPYDEGFVSGYTASDLVRTFGQKLFRLNEHIQRFRKSCELCRIGQVVEDEVLQSAAFDLAERNKLDGTELILVMFATRGPCEPYAAGEVGRPTVGMHTFP